MTLLIYGATGYTGSLIVQAAHRAGLAPILGGRNAARLEQMADQYRFTYRAFDVTRAFAQESANQIERHLEDVTVLLNCAGPFIRTAEPLMDACLYTHTHYLDIAGETPEFLAAEQRHTAAAHAGVMLMPGVGFGIAPTDSVACHLAQQLPTATRLALAFQTEGGVSRGSLTTLLAALPQPGVIRKGGMLRPAYAGEEKRRFDFGKGPVTVLSNPWRGDLVTAYHSTGILNITTYMAVPLALHLLLRLRPLLRIRALQRLLAALAQRAGAGPSPAARSAGATHIVGEVLDTHGVRRGVRMHGPEAYEFTTQTAVAAAQRVLQGDFASGFRTPAQAFGPDFVLKLPGLTFESLDL